MENNKEAKWTIKHFYGKIYLPVHENCPGSYQNKWIQASDAYIDICNCMIPDEILLQLKLLFSLS